MDITPKVREALKYQLVGDYVFSEIELDELYRKTGYLLRQLEAERGDVLGNRHDELMFVAIVNASKEWNPDEDTFWGYLFRKFVGTDAFLQKTYNYMQGVIDRVTRRHSLLYLGQFKKKYYITLSAHALSPASSMKSFYDLCWRIYRDDLCYEYVKGDPVFTLLADALCSRFSGDLDEDSDMDLGQVYYFKAWLKGIATLRSDIMVNLIESTIRDIDSLVNGVPINIEAHYASYLVSDWWKEKNSESVEENGRQGNRNKVITDYKLIKPRYVIIDEVPCIYIEAFRLKSNFDIAPTITVFSGDAEIMSHELQLQGSGLLMATKPFSLDLRLRNCKLESLTVRINQGSTTIYDSKKSLKRQFVLFKDLREITANVCEPGDYQLLVTDFDALLQYPKEIQREGLNFYSFYSEEREVIQSTDKTVFFQSEGQERDFWIVTSKQNDMVYRENGKDYDVSDGEIFIGVEPGVDTSAYSIESEGAYFEFDDFHSEEKEDGTFYQVSELMSNGAPQTISVVDIKTNKAVMAWGFVKYDNPSIAFDQPVYYEDVATGTAFFKSDKYEGEQAFCLDDEEVLISIGNGDIVVSPPVLYWCLDNGDRHHGPVEPGIWYKDLTNSTLLQTSLSGTLLFSDGSLIPSAGKGGFKLGESIYSKSDCCKDDLNVLFKVDLPSPVIVPIATVYFSEKFLAKPFDMDEAGKIMSWSPAGCFIGSESSAFRIEFTASNGDYFYGEANLEASDIPLRDLDDGYYTLKVYLKPSGFLSKEKCLLTETVCVGNKKNLKYKNATLEFTKIYPSGSSLLSKAIKPFYIDSILFIGSRDGFDFYSGYIFIETFDGRKIYLDEMTNDKGEKERINPVRMEMKDDTSCWIVYGLGESLNDFEAEFSFDKNRKKICISDNPESAIGIQYYEFEKVNYV